MREIHAESMFPEVKYTKSGIEMREACGRKSDALLAKIEERQGRIARVRADHGIDDAALVMLLQQVVNAAARRDRFAYMNSTTGQQAEVEAGVVAQLNTEARAIESEKEQAAKLRRVARNVAPDERVVLTYDDLAYLEF